MMLETIMDLVGIAVTIVSIIVTGISIVQSVRVNRKHQKSNRDSTKS